MASEYNNTSLNYVCLGCLSADRKLSTIYDAEYIRIFEEFLESMEQVKKELLLCWECTAFIRSVIRFKKKVKTAHDHLVRYMVCRTTHIESLSTLTTTICNTIHNYNNDDFVNDDKSSIDDHKTGSFTYEMDFTNSKVTSDPSCANLGLQNTSLNPDAGRVSGEQETQPVFVKIEDNDFDFGEHLYEDENVAVEDKQVEVEHKTDDTQTPSKKAKSKKKKRSKVKYDASDDEPLKSRKKERKTKKEDTGTDGSLVKKRRKKEKAAGVVTNSRVHRNLEQLNVAEGQIQMVVLSWEEVEAERQKALSSVVFTRHEYRCYDCVLGFNHRFKLENHMNKHSPSAGPAECPVCHVRCRDEHALVAHKRRHRVRSLAKLRNHMKNHAERQKCELCGKTFRDRTSLRTHLFIHRGEKEYSCPHCAKKFLFKKAMEVHLITHSAPAQLYCLECDMTFKNRMSYYQHKKYNLKHIDPAKLKYECPLCDKKFLKAVRLEEHNFAVHLKVTPIRCTMQDCDFACSSRPVLRTHIRMIHRNVRAVRNHVCDTCGKAYTVSIVN
ncbi:uncharacterized protein isoform X2 [Choristoneura fumiferana]|uniref:uncharacterized protein isoform X2 n=1 Tax=Choristoneura fumiferana TaxID=7141 RepID=UPI003D15B457